MVKTLFFKKKIHVLAWLHFFWKCGVRQCGLGKVSTGHKKNLSHYYISKKFWKPCQTFGRLVLAVWSRADLLVLSKVSRTFLKNMKMTQIFLWAHEVYLNLHWITPHFWKKSNHATIQSECIKDFIADSTYQSFKCIFHIKVYSWNKTLNAKSIFIAW